MFPEEPSGVKFSFTVMQCCSAENNRSHRGRIRRGSRIPRFASIGLLTLGRPRRLGSPPLSVQGRFSDGLDHRRGQWLPQVEAVHFFLPRRSGGLQRLLKVPQLPDYGSKTPGWAAVVSAFISYPWAGSLDQFNHPVLEKERCPYSRPLTGVMLG